jgi:hypothetical protein
VTILYVKVAARAIAAEGRNSLGKVM